MSDLVTEHVSENYQPLPGQTATRHFWIAYPAHVSAYGHMSDRIDRAWGWGRTRKEALENADVKQRLGQVPGTKDQEG